MDFFAYTRIPCGCGWSLKKLALYAAQSRRTDVALVNFWLLENNWTCQRDGLEQTFSFMLELLCRYCKKYSCMEGVVAAEVSRSLANYVILRSLCWRAIRPGRRNQEVDRRRVECGLDDLGFGFARSRVTAVPATRPCSSRADSQCPRGLGVTARA